MWFDLKNKIIACVFFVDDDIKLEIYMWIDWIFKSSCLHLFLITFTLF